MSTVGNESKQGLPAGERQKSVKETMGVGVGGRGISFK